MSPDERTGNVSDLVAPITGAELSRLLGGCLEGDGAHVVREVGTLEEAGPEAVSWMGNPKLLPRLEESRAGIVLVPSDCPIPAGRTVIRVADPDLALCELLRHLGPPVEAVPVGTHTTAVVAPDAIVEGVAIGAHVVVGPRAKVGAGTHLHAGVCLGADVAVGRDCVLWPNVVVRERATIGDRVTIHPNATIGADGFSYLQRGGRHVKIPQIGTVVIEDDVEIGAGSCIDRARSGVTRIGHGCKIDNLVQIGHNVTLGEGCVIVAQCGIAGSTSLGHHVVFSGHVGVTDHRRIGDGAVVAAQSSVMGDIPDGKTYRGSPATEITQYARQKVSLRRLPKVIEQVRELARRVEKLESSANDRA